MYEKLSNEISERILSDGANLSPFACKDESALRRTDNPHDYASAVRSSFIRDCDKILHCPFFPRYGDKTQVFSLYRNDDITRRSLHVQIVSRVARTIGKALKLNCELIEAIALGHDVGHTPFGHTGERVLDGIVSLKTGKRFLHALQSVRVLDVIFPSNLTLQTLDGILSHNGEHELKEYAPVTLPDFKSFDERAKRCSLDAEFSLSIVPCTLEGCVVRVSDIISYLGKDRQDAMKTAVAGSEDFTDLAIGSFNAEMINNLTVNIIENSYGKPFISMDDEHFSALQTAKKENYSLIYSSEKTCGDIADTLSLMMEKLYEKLLKDLVNGVKQSPVFIHHVDLVNESKYKRKTPYSEQSPHDIVTDFIAAMTDDYFSDVFSYLFPSSPLCLKYKGYFD